MEYTERTGEVGRAGFCKKCEQWVPDGPDLCLGLLKGVFAACCGHGNKIPYVAFGDAAEYHLIGLYGTIAEMYFKHIKENPHRPFFTIGLDEYLTEQERDTF